MKFRIFLFLQILSISVYAKSLKNDSLDISDFVAVYDYTCHTVDEAGDSVQDIARYVLQVGDKYNCFLPWSEYNYQTTSEHKLDLESKMRESKVFMPTILVSKEDGTCINNSFIYPNIFQSISRMEKIDWKIIEIIKEIDGYYCSNAIANFHGIEWQVWYTEEIPADAGPWKLNGLPGLIVEALSNNGCHHFKLKELKQKQTSILRPESVNVSKLSQKSMMKYVNKTLGNNRYMKEPYYYIGNLQSTIKNMNVVNNNSIRNVVLINGCIYKQDAHKYQPLELK